MGSEDPPGRSADEARASARKLADELRELGISGIDALTAEAVETSRELAAEAHGLLTRLSESEARMRQLSDEGVEHAIRLADRIKAFRIRAVEHSRRNAEARALEMADEGKRRTIEMAEQELRRVIALAEKMHTKERDRSVRLVDESRFRSTELSDEAQARAAEVSDEGQERTDKVSEEGQEEAAARAGEAIEEARDLADEAARSSRKLADQLGGDHELPPPRT